MPLEPLSTQTFYIPSWIHANRGVKGPDRRSPQTAPDLAWRTQTPVSDQAVQALEHVM